MGRDLAGIYHLSEDRIYVYEAAGRNERGTNRVIQGLHSSEGREFLGDRALRFDDEIDLVRGGTAEFDPADYLAGKTVARCFFGSAISNFGVEELLAHFAVNAPGPAGARHAAARSRVGRGQAHRFVFKIQANMDPQHRERHRLSCACVRASTTAACACTTCGSRRRCASPTRSPSWLRTVRRPTKPLPATSSDCINHGTINIGDTFTEGEKLTFTGIPNFAPEMFRRAVLKDPLKIKQLAKGLDQLCEEGAITVVQAAAQQRLDPRRGGPAAVRVVAFRLQDEYAVSAVFDNITVHTARWVYCDDGQAPREFRTKAYDNLAVDHSGALVYLAPSRVNLELTIERWPKISFRATREHLAA